MQEEVNMLQVPGKEELAQKHGTEIIVMSSPRGDYHTSLVLIYGKPVYLTKLHTDKTTAEEETLQWVKTVWLQAKRADAFDALRTPVSPPQPTSRSRKK